MRRRLRTWFLGLVLVGPAASLGIPAALTTAAAIATEAAAQAARSSGGYARPGGGSFGRTPSVGGSRVTPRTPPTSGGYRRPTTPSAPPAYERRPPIGAPSAGDRTFSRERSGAALDRYRAEAEAARRRQQEAARPQQPPMSLPQPRPAPPGGSGWPPGGTIGRDGPFGGGAGGGWYRPSRPPVWYRDRGWTPPGHVLGGPRSFGVWDALFLWFLLDNLNRPGSIDFFRNHRDDPAIREWRAEAERLARDNATLRADLEALDRQLARQPDDAPRDPNYLPPGTPPEVAVTPREDARTPTTTGDAPDAGGLGGVWFVVLAGGSVLLVLLARRRRRAAATAAAGQTGRNPPAQGSGPMGPLGTAGAMLRQKLSGERYTPSLFRVGMTLQADPTPFVLAAGVTKVPAPETGGGGGNLLVGVQEVGRVEGGAADLIRLHLPDGRSMFQLHLDAGGRPDECRFFGRIDEVTPADSAEWGAWLDPAEGMIGWPEFQTRDGKVYARAWAPGPTRIAPRTLTETIESVGGTRTLRSQAMLYAASTGAAPPAPETEYILVAAVEAGDGQAWVEIHAGIDVNPAALSLA